MKLIATSPLFLGPLVAATINNNATSSTDSVKFDAGLFSVAVFEQTAYCGIVMTDSLLSSPFAHSAMGTLWKRALGDDETVPPEKHLSPTSSSASTEPLLASVEPFSVERDAPLAPRFPVLKTRKSFKDVGKKIAGHLKKAVDCVGEFCAELNAEGSGNYMNAHMVMYGLPPPRTVQAHRRIPSPEEVEEQQMEQAMRNSLEHQHSGSGRSQMPLRTSSGPIKIEGSQELLSSNLIGTKHIKGHGKLPVQWQGKEKKHYDEHELVYHPDGSGSASHRGSSSHHIYTHSMIEHQQQQKPKEQHQTEQHSKPLRSQSLSAQSTPRKNFKGQVREGREAVRRKNTFEVLFGDLFQKKSSTSHGHPDEIHSPAYPVEEAHAQLAHHEVPQHPLPLHESVQASSHHLVKRAVIPQLGHQEERLPSSRPDEVPVQRRALTPHEHAHILDQAKTKSPQMQARIHKYLRSQSLKNPSSAPMHDLVLDEFGMPHAPLSEKARQEVKEKDGEVKDVRELDGRMEALMAKHLEEHLGYKPETHPANAYAIHDDALKKKEEADERERLRIYDEEYHRDFLTGDAKKGKDNQHNAPQDHHEEHEAPPPTTGKGKPKLQRSKSFSGPIKYNSKGYFDPKKYAVYSGPFDKFDKKTKKADHESR